MTPVRDRDSRELKNQRTTEVDTKMSDMELMMRRLLNEQKEEIKGEIQNNVRVLQNEISGRLEDVEK
eukprot:5148153-Karenia_brevis.AAC.1